jgi:hypothetical protein
VGEHVYLKVSPLQGTKRFHDKGKLSPRYVGPYPIVKRTGKVSYKLKLPPELTVVHPVFHVSQLRKCVFVEKRVPAQALDVQETLEYLEYPVRILDWEEKSIRSTTTRFCKVLWSNHSECEATWEKESVGEVVCDEGTKTLFVEKEVAGIAQLLGSKERFPVTRNTLTSSKRRQLLNLGDEILVRGEFCNILELVCM